MPAVYQRSVIDMKQGSYIITLPRAWVNYFKIKPGTRLEVIVSRNLTIKPPKIKLVTGGDISKKHN